MNTNIAALAIPFLAAIINVPFIMHGISGAMDSSAWLFNVFAAGVCVGIGVCAIINAIIER